MKIRVIETEIEASAEELKSSNSLSDNFYNLLRNAFARSGGSYESEEPEEKEVET